MWKISRYIAKTILLSTALVLLLLVGIDIIFTFITEIANVGEGRYTVWGALHFVLFRLPSDLYIILPISGFLGSLIGLGHLSSTGELVVMRAAGVSVLQISKGVTVAALFLLIVTFLLGSYIGPVTRHIAYTTRALEQHDQAVLMGAKSTWLKNGNNFIYIGQSYPDGRLFNVVSYHIEDNQLLSITQAKSAHYDKTAKKWVLNQVSKTDISKLKITASHHNTMMLASLVPPDILRVVTLDPEDMTLFALDAYIKYRKANDLDASAYQLHLWQMLFIPLSLLLLMLMSVAFVFGSLRSSANSIRLLVGGVIGFAFFVLNQFFGSFTIVYGIWPWLGAMLPSVVLFSGLLVLWWQMN